MEFSRSLKEKEMCVQRELILYETLSFTLTATGEHFFEVCSDFGSFPNILFFFFFNLIFSLRLFYLLFPCYE